MFGVIYSRSTGRIRWICVPDYDWELSLIQPGFGEGLIAFADAHYAALPGLQALVSDVTGRYPVNDRYAIVRDDGLVMGAIFADPDCGDHIPGYRLIQSQEACPDWMFSETQGFFKPEQSWHSHSSLPVQAGLE